jgi:hypothetical protein
MRALRGAAALLRGAAGLALASHPATPAGAGALAAAELGRRQGQGCAGRHAATAAGDVSGRGRPKQKRVGKLGEKTADGRPKPDERTVADLVWRGWFKSEQEAVALLTRAKSRKGRFPFKTTEPAADWLEATLGPEPVKDGLCPAARAVKRDPLLLAYDAVTLQLKWDALTLSAERGGVGIAFSTDQAREAVRKYPQFLTYSVNTYKTGWSMLTEDGLFQSQAEARECILRGPAILRFDRDKLVKRLALLESLGFPDALTVVLANPRLLTYGHETVEKAAAWWKQSGLDSVKILTSLPTLIGGSVEMLQTKLEFLTSVGMSSADLNNAASLFGNSLDGRLRARYFYALVKHRLARFGNMITMMTVTDAAFLAMLQGGTRKDPASKAEVARYRKLVTSAKFVAWRERQEARFRRDAP